MKSSLSQTSFGAILFVLLFSVAANAGVVRIESNTLSSMRNNEQNEKEVPLFEYFGASYGTPSRNFEFNTNFSVANDSLASVSDRFNLYVLDVAYAPIPGFLRLKAGRSFNIAGSVRTTVTDSGSFELSLFEERVRFGALAGIERTGELETFKQRAKIASTYLTFQHSSVANPLSLNAVYQYRNYDDATKPIEHLGQFSASKPVPTVWSPEVLINSEFNFSDYHNRLLEVGVDTYPNSALTLRTRFTSYYVKGDEGIVEPIFAIFSQGRLYEGMVQADYRFTPAFSAGITVAYDNYEAGAGLRESGEKLVLAAKYLRGPFSATNSIYGFNSYGGKAFGDQLSLRYNLTDRIGVSAGGEVTYYDKITGSSRFAYSSLAELDVWLQKTLKASVGAELNSNNILLYDSRVVAKLTYLLWAEI